METSGSHNRASPGGPHPEHESQQKVESRLEQAEQWLRMLIDSAEDYAIFAINPEGKISSWSRGAVKLFGYDAEEIVGQDFATIFVPEDRAAGAPAQEIEHAQREGYSPDVRWHVRKNGSRLFVGGSVRPLRSKTGENCGFLKVAHDITEQKRREEQLRQSEVRYRLLLDSIKDFALFSIDVSGIIKDWNSGAERLLGYSEKEIVGQNFACLYTPEARKAGVPERERDDVIRDGVRADELWLVRKDGVPIFVAEVLRRMDDAEGNLRGFVKVAQDITVRKRLEDELRQARDNLETLVAERTAQLQETIGELEAFSYSVSHDLRAPIRTMQGFSELLQVKFGDKLGTEGAEMLKRIVNGALRADELISDVLTLSRVAREPTTLRPVDVAEVIHQLVSGTPEFQPPHLELSIASPLHKVLGHAARLSQCFSNLLWNAVKFVGPGVQPRVNVWSELMGNRVRIFVQDNGIGIPPGQGERIFGLFQRLHPDEAYQGTGVGLAIVRKAVERMNGKVGVDSTPGKGSRFWLELASIPA